MAELTALDVVVLAACSDRARYGYELGERIDELTAGRLSVRPGNLYRVLERLDGRGLVEEVRPPADADPRRRYFRATARGRRVAAAELAMYARVLRQMPELKLLPGND